jgi:hypothetical protein
MAENGPWITGKGTGNPKSVVTLSELAGIFILLGVLLVAAWRVAGYLGADYFLLPRPRLPLRLRVFAVRQPRQ